ncbi:MAG: nucleotidyltransferase family protein [Nitrososphaerales archaeon]
MKVACVVLAAGLGSRFGSAKQLAKFSSKTLLQNSLDVANGSQADYVFLVLGNRASEIMEKLNTGRSIVVLNKDYKKGLASSIKSSILNLPDDCGAVVLMVADQPFLTSKKINALIRKLAKNRRAKLASFAFHGEPRNPAIFSKELFQELKTLKGDRGANHLIKRHIEDAILINSSDPRIFVDVDTVSDLIRAKKEEKN